MRGHVTIALELARFAAIKTDGCVHTWFARRNIKEEVGKIHHARTYTLPQTYMYGLKVLQIDTNTERGLAKPHFMAQGKG